MKESSETNPAAFSPRIKESGHGFAMPTYI